MQMLFANWHKLMRQVEGATHNSEAVHFGGRVGGGVRGGWEALSAKMLFMQAAATVYAKAATFYAKAETCLPKVQLQVCVGPACMHVVTTLCC